jgi:hypothetical protein
VLVIATLSTSVLAPVSPRTRKWAEEGEEGQGDARDDVAQLGVAGEGKQVKVEVKVEVGEGGDREQRQDDPGDVPVAQSPDDVLEQAGRRG